MEDTDGSGRRIMEDRSSAKEIEKEMASPGSQLKYGCKSDNPQSRSCGTSKLHSHDSSGGAEKSNYGSFLATEETTSIVSSSGSLLRKREAEQIPSGLAFVNVSYQVPPTFGWLPGNKSMAKTILRPARYKAMPFKFSRYLIMGLPVTPTCISLGWQKPVAYYYMSELTACTENCIPAIILRSWL